MQQIVTVTVGPEAEPVTLEEAKMQLRFGVDDEDDLVRLWISAARELAEVHTGRRYVTQTVTVSLDSWPDDDVIRLEQFGVGDVTAVSSIAYLDTAGASQTFASANYQLIARHSPPLIVLTPTGTTEWPDVEEDRYYPITLTLTVGANPPVCPAIVKQAILMTLAYWDENRGGEAGESETALGLPAGAIRLLNSAWTGAYG